jgi:hypothetical protein
MSPISLEERTERLQTGKKKKISKGIVVARRTRKER